MSIILDLQPELEHELQLQASSRGLSLNDYLTDIIGRQAQISAHQRTGQELVDACAQVRGLADDLNITRASSFARPVDFS